MTNTEAVFQNESTNFAHALATQSTAQAHRAVGVMIGLTYAAIEDHQDRHAFYVSVQNLSDDLVELTDAAAYVTRTFWAHTDD